MLTADTLRGVWALVHTPWDARCELDEAALRDNVAYLCRSGVHGLCAAGPSGEFHAMEFDEFRRLVDIVVDEAKSAGMPCQIGCGWSHARGALRRAEYAVQRGADAVGMLFPYYIEPSVTEGVRFFEEVARTCGPVPLVHCNTPHAGPVLGPDDYRRLKDHVPTLIGTQLAVGDPRGLAAIREGVPEVSHFSGEDTFVPDFAGGAVGICSWLAVTNPRLAVEWYEACLRGDWDRAMSTQTRVNRYQIEVKTRWRGTTGAAVNKADAAVNPNIRCSLSVRPPYTSCTPEDVERARQWAKAYFPELLEL